VRRKLCEEKRDREPLETDTFRVFILLLRKTFLTFITTCAQNTRERLSLSLSLSLSLFFHGEKKVKKKKKKKRSVDYSVSLFLFLLSFWFSRFSSLSFCGEIKRDTKEYIFEKSERDLI